MSLGIAVLGILPPLLHFITGPLGPLIGGIFSGYRMRAHPVDAAGIGLVAGIIILAPGALILRMLGNAEAVGNSQFLILVGVATYFGLLTMLGALAGGAIAKKSDRASVDTSQKGS